MILAAVVVLALWYTVGLLRLRSAKANAVAAWRSVSVLIGLFLIWVALGSPLARHDHHLLTVHMIQHLLLMTVAPALLLLGEPLEAFWHGLPRSGRVVVAHLFQLPFTQRVGRSVSNPPFCWSCSALTLIGWHVPALFALAQFSDAWHAVEQSSFLGAGLLFWWPVVRPWPSLANRPQWSTILYLFLATLPCDILSGFLVFSDRVVYAGYLTMPRQSGFSVLEDQQFAGALMWTSVTLIYLLPATFLTTRLLSPSICEPWLSSLRQASSR